MIYTFYSYKGGVGRSMALANVGEWLYLQGARAVLVDWDLEAPGLESFFFSDPAAIETIRGRDGLVDLLAKYRKLYQRSAAGGGESNFEAAIEGLDPIESTLVELRKPQGDTDAGLWLLTAGNRAEERFAGYADLVESFDWSDFFLTFEGGRFLTWLAGQLQPRRADPASGRPLADAMLIDSRTGVTEMGGVCTQYLADVVVSFCAPNSQNLDGVLNMTRSFRRPEVSDQRGGEPPQVVVVPARVELGELEKRNEWEEEFERQIDKLGLKPAVLAHHNVRFWDLKIPYVPHFAYGEALTFGEQRVEAEELSDAYVTLGTTLCRLAPSGSSLRRRLAAVLGPDADAGSFSIDDVLAAHEIWLASDGAQGRRADLSGHDLSRRSMTQARLRQAVMVGVNLEGADLSGSDLREADLQDARLSGAVLKKADLSRCNLERADLSGCKATKAAFVGARLNDGDLSGALLDESNLSVAQLGKARLARASLANCVLTGADLTGANLEGTVLHGADLSEAVGLTERQLATANVNSRTRGPDFGTAKSTLTMGPPRPAQDDEKRDETREKLRRRAQDTLRGAGGDPERLLEHANQLKNLNEFGYARRLLGRAREQSVQEPRLRLKLAQRHCLCTYKDPDLPVHKRLERALEILQEVEDLKTTTDQETLGLAGAIYKRKWQVDTDKAHLERALAHYLRGYRQGPEKDQGYTGINAAYVLDLLAHIEEADAQETGTASSTSQTRRTEANRIRRKLVDVLPPLLAEPGNEWLNTWWFPTTVAEAYFGLGDYREAGKWLQRAKALPTRPPLWEFESTAVQLASLAGLQPAAPESFEELQRSDAWRVVEELLDGRADAVQTVFAGKFGLALSGGGFRASFFHIGVLAKLAELDLLRHVHVLSCVSGGSIVGAHYYLAVRQLLQRQPDRPGTGGAHGAITRESYIELVQDLERQFMRGVERNIRTRLVSNLWQNLKMAFSSTYSRTARAGELYESKLFAALRGDGEDKRFFLDALRIQPPPDDPARAPTAFKPKQDNWLRRNKVPMLVLNATTLNTAHNWQFTSSWMGESPFSIDPEVDGNWRYRRMYYGEAPEPYRSFRLGQAVAASACVPGLFEPIALPGLYPEQESALPEMTVRLVDGGVHDNQGIASLLEQDCTALFVSDASGQMTSEPQPGGGIFAPLLRSNTALMERVRQLQFFDLKARRRAALLKNLTIVHLKKDLEGDAVSWRSCKEPPDEPLRRRGDLLPYGVSRRVQKLLAAIRTDLDAFSEVEAHSLMASGYLMTEHYARELGKSLQIHEAGRHDWAFLDVEAALRGDAERTRQRRFEKLLAIGAEKAFKVWRMSPVLQVLAGILLLGALGGFGWLWYLRPDLALVDITLGDMGSALAWTLAGLVLGKTAVSVLRYKDTLRKVLKDIAIAVGGFVLAQLHLRLFNGLFLRLGTVQRVLGPRTKADREAAGLSS